MSIIISIIHVLFSMTFITFSPHTIPMLGEIFLTAIVGEMLEIGSAGIQRLCKLQDQVIESISNSQHSSSFEING